ncbi:TPA: DsbA family protein [Providencia rettgeri]
MQKKISNLTIVIYTLFIILISTLMTVLYYQVFVFESFKNNNESQQSFFEFSEEKVLLSPIKEDNSIIEVMSYGCYYCGLNNDAIMTFANQLPEGENFSAIHLAKKYTPLAAYSPIFATLEEMNLESGLRADIFNAVLNENIDLKNKDELLKWLKQHNVDTEKYLEISQTPAISEKLEYMESIADYYNITATPAFIINKKYVVYQDRDFPEFTKYMAELLAQSKQE